VRFVDYKPPSYDDSKDYIIGKAVSQKSRPVRFFGKSLYKEIETAFDLFSKFPIPFVLKLEVKSG